MTRRKSYQKGNVQFHNGQWTLRYRELDHSTSKWSLKREVLGEFKNKKAAFKAAEPIMARVNERNNSTAPHKLYAEITFKDFIAGRWSDYTVVAKHQVSTTECNNSLIKNHLMPFFDDRKMVEITPSDISHFLNSKQGLVSGNTMQNLYGLLHLMFDIAHQYDLIEHNPIRPKLHKPEFERVEKPTLLAAEVRGILAKLPKQEQSFALLIAVTGMRMGEALALRWMDFDVTRLELSINHTLYRLKLKQPKTKSSKRPLRLAPSIAELLVSHREQSAFQAEDDFIFCRADGRPLNPTALRTHLYDAMDSVGIKRVKGQYGFHIFRHTAGSLLYAKSRDLKLVQNTLGHSDISTTSDIYVHLDDKVMGEGTEILAREILGNCDLSVTQCSKMVS
jgi:integrase